MCNINKKNFGLNKISLSKRNIFNPPPPPTQIRNGTQTVQRTSQRRQSARLFLQSSELGPPHPLTHREGAPPLVPGGGTHRLAVEGVGGLNSDEGKDTVVL